MKKTAFFSGNRLNRAEMKSVKGGGIATVAASCAGQFCGGIAGIQCAGDCKCKLDGNYPDAGGECIA